MSEEIDRWISYMKEHPGTWKEEHTKFINAQFEKQQEFCKRLLQTENGREKLIALYGIQNTSGYSKLLSQNKKRK
jgi:uncharacterized protein YfdQ (DUF2303 family)